MNAPSRRRKITIVVPFLNEQENLPLLCEELCKSLDPEPEDKEFRFPV